VESEIGIAQTRLQATNPVTSFFLPLTCKTKRIHKKRIRESGPTLIEALGSDLVAHASIDGHSTEAARSVPPGFETAGGTSQPAPIDCSVGPAPPHPIQLACAFTGSKLLQISGAIPEPSAGVDYVSIELAHYNDAAWRPRVHFSSTVSAHGRFSAMVPLQPGRSYRLAARAHRRGCAEDGGNFTFSSRSWMPGSGECMTGRILPEPAPAASLASQPGPATLWLEVFDRAASHAARLPRQSRLRRCRRGGRNRLLGRLGIAAVRSTDVYALLCGAGAGASRQHDDNHI
jgi:hypothetical protein